jgi:uncharacterized RDD family membrane protein YckC
MATQNPYAPPTAPVRDMGSPDAQNELAGRGARLGAVILDGIIASLLIYVPMGIGIGIQRASLPPITDTLAFYTALFTGPGAIFSLVGFLIWAAINAYLVHRHGQTIGKKILGIKVVRTDGSRASLGRIFWLRNVVMVLLSVIPIAGMILSLVDALLIFRESRQCLHDQIAGTIVVKA